MYITIKWRYLSGKTMELPTGFARMFVQGSMLCKICETYKNII